MSRTLKILAWTIGALVVLPLLLITLVVTVVNIDWGQRLAERMTAQFSGGNVVLTGVSGHFPDDLRIARVEVRDEETPWLNAEDITVQWSPARLTGKVLQVELLHAGRVDLLRLPARSPPPEERESRLPVRIDIAPLDIDRFDIGAPIAGAAASVSVQGNVHAASLQDADAALRIKRLDAPGSYELTGHVDTASIKAKLNIDEPSQGLLAGLAKLPDVGAISIQASVEGPRNAEAMRLTVAAGPLRAAGQGNVDLVGQSVDVDLTMTAPAMAPRQDVSWDNVSLQAHVHGPFTEPDASGQVRIAGFRAGGAQLGNVNADVQGNRGSVAMQAVVERLRIPGPKPDLFQAAP